VRKSNFTKTILKVKRLNGSTSIEVWGHKIIKALDHQSQLIINLSKPREVVQGQLHCSTPSDYPVDDPGALESKSRKDVLWTPITSSDKILDWVVFPQSRPFETLPASAYAVKPNKYIHGSRWP
jgi:hypothetical protein